MIKKIQMKRLTENGYVLARNKKGFSVLEHRMVWEDNKGEIPLGYVIHHINGDKKDNRIENLECMHPKIHSKLHRKKNRKRIIYPSGAVKVIRLAEYL